ncbi:hypothetical protein AAMO2058_001108600 [Amorphochlora amoebiformis]
MVKRKHNRRRETEDHRKGDEHTGDFPPYFFVRSNLKKSTIICARGTRGPGLLMDLVSRLRLRLLLILIITTLGLLRLPNPENQHLRSISSVDSGEKRFHRQDMRLKSRERVVCGVIGAILGVLGRHSALAMPLRAVRECKDCQAERNRTKGRHNDKLDWLLGKEVDLTKTGLPEDVWKYITKGPPESILPESNSEDTDHLDTGIKIPKPTGFDDRGMRWHWGLSGTISNETELEDDMDDSENRENWLTINERQEVEYIDEKQYEEFDEENPRHMDAWIDIHPFYALRNKSYKDYETVEDYHKDIQEAHFPEFWQARDDGLPRMSDGMIVRRVVGTGDPGVEDGVGINASIDAVYGLAFDRTTASFVWAESRKNLIRLMTPDYQVFTIAGSGLRGSDDGPGFLASFNNPFGVACGPDGTIYVADTYNRRIRKIARDTRRVSTLLDGADKYSKEDPRCLFNPYDLTVDSKGNVFVTDLTLCRIVKITPSGEASIFAGFNASGGAYLDGMGSLASFQGPYGIGIDPWDNLYVGDPVPYDSERAKEGLGERRHSIRKISPDGQVTTFAGNSPTGLSDYHYSDGHVEVAEFHEPFSIGVDWEGNVYTGAR